MHVADAHAGAQQVGAAVRIQTAFRGWTARELRAMEFEPDYTDYEGLPRAVCPACGGVCNVRGECMFMPMDECCGVDG